MSSKAQYLLCVYYHIILFNNQCLVEFALHNMLFKINGYIKTDPLNIFIRTSQISNIFLFNKKIRFEELINYSKIEYNDVNDIKKISKEISIHNQGES